MGVTEKKMSCDNIINACYDNILQIEQYGSYIHVPI